MNPQDIFTDAVVRICASHAIPPEAILGKGAEAIVYDRGDNTVLKVHKNTSWVFLQSMQELTRRLTRASLPFATPEIISISEEEGYFVTIEKRLSGISLSELFPSYSYEEKKDALRQYIEAVHALRVVDVHDISFGQIVVATDQVQADSWQEFLMAKVRRQVERAGERLRSDVPNIDEIIARFEATTTQIFDASLEKHLVHGDYILGNTLFDTGKRLSAMLDFSANTVAGDSRMDLASAIMYIGDTRDPDGTLTEYAREVASGLCNEDMQRYVDIYSLYYALNFSDCYMNDPGTYEWCLNVLRAQ